MAKREQTNHPRTKPSNSQVADIPKVPSARTPISQKSEPAARKLAIHKRKHGSCCDEWMAHDPLIEAGHLWENRQGDRVGVDLTETVTRKQEDHILDPGVVCLAFWLLLPGEQRFGIHLGRVVWCKLKSTNLKSFPDKVNTAIGEHIVEATEGPFGKGILPKSSHGLRSRHGNREGMGNIRLVIMMIISIYIYASRTNRLVTLLRKAKTVGASPPAIADFAWTAH